MGIVYRATDTRLNRPAAIKVLPENLADPEARRRFQREAQMVSSLNHPHIVTVYDAGEYLDRQYSDHGVRGRRDATPVGREAARLATDRRALDRRGRGDRHGPRRRHSAPRHQAREHTAREERLRETCRLRSREAVRSGSVRGRCARRDSRHGAELLVGTAAYMSPEQMQGWRSTARSDVYSFGLVLYELLSGSRPFADREALQASRSRSRRSGSRCRRSSARS